MTLEELTAQVKKTDNDTDAKSLTRTKSLCALGEGFCNHGRRQVPLEMKRSGAWLRGRKQAIYNR